MLIGISFECQLNFNKVFSTHVICPYKFSTFHIQIYIFDVHTHYFIMTFVSLIFYTYIFNSIVKVTLTSSVLQFVFHYRVLRTFVLRYHLAFIAGNRIIPY